MEYRELYDENLQPLGRALTEGEPIPPDAYELTVGIWIVDHQKRILITKRSAEKRFAPGKWENPSGHVQQGETREEAVIRELQEETGITVRPEDVILLGTGRVWPHISGNYLANMDVDLADVRLQPGETCDVQLVTLDELDRMFENGDMASSALAHMAFYREAFEKYVK